MREESFSPSAEHEALCVFAGVPVENIEDLPSMANAADLVVALRDLSDEPIEGDPRPGPSRRP